MNKEQEQWVKETFKEGEYVQISMLVKTNELEKLIKILENSELNLLIMPKAKENSEFYNDEGIDN